MLDYRTIKMWYQADLGFSQSVIITAGTAKSHTFKSDITRRPRCVVVDVIKQHDLVFLCVFTCSYCNLPDLYSNYKL